ncbi:NAD(P)-dependent oxidoreductase [Chitinispirillales bacterium ANBcel5]|uniref:NAD-dependent epimerase/dehydratase family protein n=1 Tax=Cellulosispirillum alkaliphilum TaxID=3039283 RepID=UPI002A54D911|nr:NAD(P)-dependent oxidoreductase [Chitinispirillales bacterium ANBcel5]
MKIFVTGGSGFIGSYIVQTLIENNYEVTTLVRNPDKLPELYNIQGVSVIEGGFEAKEAISQSLQDHDVCIHVALGWGETPLTMLKNDTEFTAYLLETAENAGVKQFIYTSSTAAVGEIRPLMTPQSVCRPTDLYGATKAASEAYILGFCSKATIRGNIVRPGYTFGNPVFRGGSTQPDRRFHTLVKNALENKPLEVIKYDGTQFIWAGDLARIYLSLVQTEENRSVMHGLAREFVSWEQIARWIKEITGSESEIKVEDKGWGADPAIFDVSYIKNRWGHSFESEQRLKEHIEYLTTVFAASTPS